MLQRWCASFAALAVFLGFVAAPHTHLHQADAHRPVIDEDHGGDHAWPIVHSHFSPHGVTDTTDDPALAEPDNEEVVSLATFVFDTGKLPAPVAGLQITLSTPGGSSVWRQVNTHQPRSHAPPPVGLPSPRAPPLHPSLVS